MSKRTMKIFLGKPLNVFLVLFVFLGLIFFLIPINLFDGVIVLKNGIQEELIDTPLALSYFISIGYSNEDMVGVKDFYLLPKGYVMAFIFIFCIPALTAYRVHLGKSKNENRKE